MRPDGGMIRLDRPAVGIRSLRPCNPVPAGLGRRSLNATQLVIDVHEILVKISRHAGDRIRDGLERPRRSSSTIYDTVDGSEQA